MLVILLGASQDCHNDFSSYKRLGVNSPRGTVNSHFTSLRPSGQPFTGFCPCHACRNPSTADCNCDSRDPACQAIMIREIRLVKPSIQIFVDPSIALFYRTTSPGYLSIQVLRYFTARLHLDICRSNITLLYRTTSPGTCLTDRMMIREIELHGTTVIVEQPSGSRVTKTA